MSIEVKNSIKLVDYIESMQILEKRVKDRTWMEWRGFPKSEQELPEEVRAVTDKQFTANL